VVPKAVGSSPISHPRNQIHMTQHDTSETPINLDTVFVDQGCFENAWKCLEQDMSFGELSAEAQRDAATIIAKSMSFLDVKLFLEEIGSDRYVAVQLEDDDEIRGKTIVTYAVRTGQGVEHECCLADTADVTALLE
jgi:hypothetical protein